MNLPQKTKPTVLKNLRGFFTRKNAKFKTDEGVVHLPLVAWDSISICNGQSCPVNARRCPYFRRIAQRMIRTNEEQRCHVQAKYLRLVYQNLISAHTRKNLKQMDEAVMTNIGLLLLPLYGHLIKFKLIEAGLDYDQMIRPNGLAHTAYSEIRKTIQSIKEVSKEILPQNIRQHAIEALDVSGMLDESRGQASYHERIERSAERQYAKGKYELQTKQ